MRECAPKAEGYMPPAFSMSVALWNVLYIVLSMSALFQVKLCCFKHICAVLISSEIESSLSVLT